MAGNSSVNVQPVPNSREPLQQDVDPDEGNFHGLPLFTAPLYSNAEQTWSKLQSSPPLPPVQYRGTITPGSHPNWSSSSVRQGLFQGNNSWNSNHSFDISGGVNFFNGTHAAYGIPVSEHPQELSAPELNHNEAGGKSHVVTKPPHQSSGAEKHQTNVHEPLSNIAEASNSFAASDPRLCFYAQPMPPEHSHHLPRFVPLDLPQGWRSMQRVDLEPVVLNPHDWAFRLTPAGPVALTPAEVFQYRITGVSRSRRTPQSNPDPMVIDLELIDDELTEFMPPNSRRGDPDQLTAYADPLGGLPPKVAYEGAVRAKKRKLQGPLSPSVVRSIEQESDGDAALLCPMGIIDVEDAWAWIRHMAQNPTPEYHAPNRKPDERLKSAHKVKHPIPELMMVALKPPGSGIGSQLKDQDALPFCQTRSITPPEKVGVHEHLGSHVELTLIECAAYFPRQAIRPEYLKRFRRAGMGSVGTVSLINMLRQLTGKSNFHESRLSHTFKRYGCTADNNATRDFTAQQWTPDTGSKTIDYPLLALEHGVVHLPQGDDAGPLTKLIQWCKNNAQHRVLLSEVPALLSTAGISSTIARPADGRCPDRVAHGRHHQAIQIDRKRILKIRHELDRTRRAANAVDEEPSETEREEDPMIVDLVE
ncbi:hypothetical protein BU26DRAFT_507989 [Trematosphaeria pertusa]|uniref:Uncharacterized protein n=1 Tax=Trematosphaeria pertusa TaxID=390896 RepID=A0A6A6I4R6_9PLEO|nr:uncharacterized protein BU26DRAFT_507989 [Trematosphaeria pertusa]KAF2245306.1 hypothetical protein BU26DRAFT_507989 [Trematosphaeria pertusa]